MTQKSKKIPKSTRFEDALKELEKIVGNLESGDLALDKSLEQFERGVTLARFCQQSLTEADQKVKVLLQDEDKETLADFEEQD